jgi:hypothetical protein
MNEKEWRYMYRRRLVERGVSERFADFVSDSAEYEPDISPEDSADDEISCWCD